MMVLLDTNIVIYSVDPKYPQVRRYLASRRYGVSVITTIEALGYMGITSTQETDLREVMMSGRVMDLTSPIVDEAIRLRKSRKIKLGDAIIAASALVADVELVTRNEQDFRGIPGLRVVNPIDTVVDADT